MEKPFEEQQKQYQEFVESFKNRDVHEVILDSDFQSIVDSDFSSCN
jgi:hypothetical protein